MRSSSKTRRSLTKNPAETISNDDIKSVNTKESKKKKKKKGDKEKKKKAKDETDSEVSSIPSKVEMNDSDSRGSSPMTDSSFKKKKAKDKDNDKSKHSKESKSKPAYPSFPADDFGDGLEGLAEEFKRSKEKYDGVETQQNISNVEDSNLFENAWNDQNNNVIQRSSSFAHDENDPYSKNTDLEAKESESTAQQEEILKLQQQLSTALQKQLTMSEEHIKEKNEFMNVSRDLERMKAELIESQEERQEAIEELKERDRIIEEDKTRIDNLEQAIDKQLGKEEELLKNVHQSEEEIEHLLEEIQKFEKQLENGESGSGGASFVELRNAKKDLTEKEDEIASQALRIEQLEEELKDAMTVPQLQIDELDQENKALQGRLKGERLEYTSKLSSKDDIIQNLRSELANYTASPDAQDLSSALQKLADAREDATTVREDLATMAKKVEELRGEREDYMEEFNLLKDNNGFMEKTVKDLTEKADGLAKKVLEWTEKTYDWKQRAEVAERKIKENEDKEKALSETGESDPPGDFVDETPQTMFLQEAMDKGKKGGKKGVWGYFNKESQDLSAEEVRIRVLEEQNQEYEAKLAQLSSDIVKMQTGHKEELYTTKKRIAQLEGENEALALQNSTLEQLAKG